jgi:hypothetical protein
MYFMTFSRSVYVVQPYWVGKKDKKSLGLIIPAQVAREQHFNASTVFALRIVGTKIVLQVISPETKDEEIVTITAGESLEASGQQVPSSGAH